MDEALSTRRESQSSLLRSVRESQEISPTKNALKLNKQPDVVTPAGQDANKSLKNIQNNIKRGPR